MEGEQLLHPSPRLLFLVTVLDTTKPKARQAEWVPLKAKDRRTAMRMAEGTYPAPRYKVTRAKRVNQAVADSVLSELKLMEQKERQAPRVT